MSDFSPMMRRVRHGNSLKLRFPKKGRIRLVLILLLIGVILKLGVKSLESGTQKKEVGQALPSELKKRGETIGFKDISTILKQSSVNISSDFDTVTHGKNSYVFHYSLDSSLQKLGNTLMKRYKPLYGAIVAIHPNTGRVLSIISYNNDSVANLGNLYCRSIFPAASIFKTITAAAAIESANFDAQSLVKHAGRNHTLYKFQLEKELRQFTEIPFEKAYALSINPVFARIGIYTLGKQALHQYSQKFGFDTPIPFELDIEMSHASSPDSNFDIAELASGFNQETTLSPLHGALMASAISEKGRMPLPFIVDSVTISDSCIYKAQKGVWKNPIKEHTASELRKMMQSVSRYGTARKSFRYIRQSSRFDNIEYGGKTGSVDKDSVGRVDWFVGFARDPEDPQKRIAIGVVTAHGAYWTVHSSFIAAEYFRIFLRMEQEKKSTEKRIVSSSSIDGKSQDKAQL